MKFKHNAKHQSSFPRALAFKFVLIAVLALIVHEATMLERCSKNNNLRPEARINTGSNAFTKITFSPIDIGKKAGSPLIINIGSNIDPILPREYDDPCTTAIAVEPIVPHQIPSHPSLLVVSAAVTGSSNGSALSAMRTYNALGVSSSLAKPAKEAFWNKGQGQIKLVPSLSMKALLDATQLYKLQFIKTDMQGFDFDAVSSVNLADYNLPRIQTEVNVDGHTTYNGPKNDLCWDWWPEMKRQGYVLDAIPQYIEKMTDDNHDSQKILDEICLKQTSGKTRPVNRVTLKERNALWRHHSIPSSTFADYEYPVNKGAVHRFSEQDYSHCTS